MPSNYKIQVSSELGTLQRIIIHSPDGGIGKIVPSKFKDWLYDDTVFLKQMRKEYNDYVKLLLYFLDPEKIPYIQSFEKNQKEDGIQLDCFKPGHPAYFNSDKVLDTEYLLAKVLRNGHLRDRLIASVCAIEGCSYETEKELCTIEDEHELARVLITGVLPQKDARRVRFVFQPLPNFIFTRDISIVINNHLLLSKAATEARERESLLMRYIAYHELFADKQDSIIEINESNDFFLLDDNQKYERRTSLEGGDIMMIAPNHLLVGCSERTTPSAVNKIVHAVFKNKTGIEKVTVIKIPSQRAIMHIDTVFTHVRKDVWVLFGRFSEVLMQERNERKFSYYDDFTHSDETFEEVEIIRFYKPAHIAYNPSVDYRQDIVFKGMEDLLRNISIKDFDVPENEVNIVYSGNNIFPYDEREQWTDACNLLALKDGVAIAYDRNEETLKAFKEAGFAIKNAQDLFKEFESGKLTPEKVKNTIITLCSHELSRARGGAHCMSLPLLRAEL
jgi:arginine deiminase